MARLTKQETKNHNKALEILKKDSLNIEEKEFVFNNWNEGATHTNSAFGAFFTPLDMAYDFALDVYPNRIIDLCAGIGVLSYCIKTRYPEAEITCVELNPDYVEVGKRLVPEANWICSDVFDVLGMDLGRFDCAVSNPPFGRVKRSGNAPRYTGAEFEYHVIDIASQIADYGVFILPQMSAGFNYSGKRYYERQTSGKAFDFQKQMGMHFDAGVGVDTSYYQNDWKGVSPLCEIVTVDFLEKYE